MRQSELLAKSFLFRGLGREEIEELIISHPPIVREYKRGDTVYSSASGEGLVGFILSGCCEVTRERTSGQRTVINLLSEGDSFGILSVLSAEEFPTRIRAARASEILFFSADDVRRMLDSSREISGNLISFLAGRISFLNRKIVTFSGKTVEERLAAFILSEADRLKGERIGFNYVKTSEEINAGRASVYRAVESLSADRLISVEGKILTILDRTGLERIIK